MSASNPYSALDPSRNRPTTAGTSAAVNATDSTSTHSPQQKKRRSRGGRKKRHNRHQSLVQPPDESHDQAGMPVTGTPGARNSFYMGHNLSGTSLDSDAELMDHRDQHWAPRPRRTSSAIQGASFVAQSKPDRESRLRTAHSGQSDQDGEGEDEPLLATSTRTDAEPARTYGSSNLRPKFDRFNRRGSSISSRRNNPHMTPSVEYDLNTPPSMPPTPKMGPADGMDITFEDMMMHGDMDHHSESAIDDGESMRQPPPNLERRHTMVEEDVCFFPQEVMSEMADDELRGPLRRSRRRRRRWPDFGTLDKWHAYEVKRNETKGTKRITEPPLIGGRLRPTANKGWYQAEEEAPFRFTYFNEDFESTIHSQTISGLVQHGSTYQELFLPDPPVLSDSEDDEVEDHPAPVPVPTVQMSSSLRTGNGHVHAKVPTRQPSLSTTHAPVERNLDALTSPKFQTASAAASNRNSSGEVSPAREKTPVPGTSKSPVVESDKPVRYGSRPVWWLDVLDPSEAELKVLCKTFGIHALTEEDIRLQEQREKVELFPNYYFVNYRSFDQVLAQSEFETDFEPIDMYAVVFHDGVITFHYHPTPHPANVRRRIRNIRDSMGITADWINYALIDDITDAFAPLIQNIEKEVDDIDETILTWHSAHDSANQACASGRDGEKTDCQSISSQKSGIGSGKDMFRRVGTCRKKVMSLLRLLGHKADVIKGFAKRCNEQWHVAPRSDIGLYLGDVQDHLITMTGNLSHYEMILARAHGNYLAQVQIRMTEQGEQSTSKLNMLTVIGTIVLPMNLATGLWGMNVWVPGQEHEGDLTWFFSISVFLLIFGIACYWVSRRILKLF